MVEISAGSMSSGGILGALARWGQKKLNIISDPAEVKIPSRRRPVG